MTINMKKMTEEADMKWWQCSEMICESTIDDY